MSYQSSQNLVQQPDFAILLKKGFRLKSSREAGVKHTLYVCPYCKKMYKTKPFVSAGNGEIKCKYCQNIVTIDDVNGNFVFHRNDNPYIYQFTSIPTVLCGIQRDDVDGHLVAVNGTIFEQNHCVSYVRAKNDPNLTQKYNQYTVKYRTIFNLDQNQVYFVTTPSPFKDQKDGFTHFMLKNYKWVTTKHATSNKDELLYAQMIRTVYEQAYGYELPYAVRDYPSLSLAQCFYLLKFPIVMQYAWQEHRRIYDSNKFVLEFFHWMSNADRKLRPMLICREDETFCQMWNTYLHDTFSCDVDVKTLFANGITPLFLLLAWQLGHFGFKDIESCIAIEDALLSVHSCGTQMSMPMLFLLTKRNHAINKFYRRLLACHGESSVIQMIIHSSIQGDYESYAYCYRIEFHQKLQHLDFALENFNVTLDSFLQ